MEKQEILELLESTARSSQATFESQVDQIKDHLSIMAPVAMELGIEAKVYAEAAKTMKGYGFKTVLQEVQGKLMYLSRAVTYQDKNPVSHALHLLEVRALSKVMEDLTSAETK